MCSSFRVGFKFMIDGESIKLRLFPHMEKADTFEALTHDEQFHLMQNNLEEPDSRIIPNAGFFQRVLSFREYKNPFEVEII